MGGKPRRTRPAAVGDDVFAERVYELVTESGEQREARLRIGKPHKVPSGEFVCSLEVTGAERFRPSGIRICGVDGIQALQLSMLMAHTSLRHSDAFESGRLRFCGEPELALPGHDSTDLTRLDSLFENEAGFARLLAVLFASPSMFAARARRALGAHLGVAIDFQPVDVDLEPSRSSDFESTPGPELPSIIAYPSPETVVGIELALRQASVRPDIWRRQRETLGAAESCAARDEHRPARTLRSLYIVPDQASSSVADANLPSGSTVLPWSDLFAIFDRCHHLEGTLQESVLPTLCKTAAARYPELRDAAPRPWTIRFPERERVWQTLRRAHDEFQDRLKADPDLSGVVWDALASRGEDSDSLFASFRPGNPVPRFRRLSLSTRVRQDGSVDEVVLKVLASGSSDPGSERRLAALERCARNLRWRPSERHDERSTVSHHFKVDASSPETTTGGMPLRDVLVEGLMAYAYSFRTYLTGE